MAQTTKIKKPTQAQVKKLIGKGQQVKVCLQLPYDKESGYIYAERVLDKSVWLEVKALSGEVIGICELKDLANINFQFTPAKAAYRMVNDLIKEHADTLNIFVSEIKATLLYDQKCHIYYNDSQVYINGLSIRLPSEALSKFGIEQGQVFPITSKWLLLQEVFS